MANIFDFTGRVAVITGCSTGLGVQMAKALANQGCNIVAIARRQNLLEEVYEGVKTGQLNGNFGMKQDTLTRTAVVYDTEPMTTEMIAFTMQSGDVKNGVCNGGNVFADYKHR